LSLNARQRRLQSLDAGVFLVCRGLFKEFIRQTRLDVRPLLPFDFENFSGSARWIATRHLFFERLTQAAVREVIVIYRGEHENVLVAFVSSLQLFCARRVTVSV
jgi:hypothetical protein